MCESSLCSMSEVLLLKFQKMKKNEKKYSYEKSAVQCTGTYLHDRVRVGSHRMIDLVHKK